MEFGHLPRQPIIHKPGVCIPRPYAIGREQTQGQISGKPGEHFRPQVGSVSAPGGFLWQFDNARPDRIEMYLGDFRTIHAQAANPAAWPRFQLLPA